MLPADRIQVRIVGSQAVLLWLGSEDQSWLSALINDFARLDGRPYREVVTFLQEPPRVPSPAGKRRMAIWMLQTLSRREKPPLNAGALRDALAVEAQRARDASRFDRSVVIAASAHNLGMPAASVDALMFSDLPGERRLRISDPLPDPHTLATRTNLALAQGVLRLASEISIELYGGARAVVRQVHLRRLLCTVRHAEPEGVRLEISGPFSLFRHTTIYGRALASILPLLPWCERFDLTARCSIRGREVTVHLGPDDPIAIGEPPRAYDSRLEERFAREFARTTLDWDLVREPEPVVVADALVFPDFAVVHRRDPSRRFLLEIVGYWTPEYLQAKIDRLRAMSPIPLVLCIDRGLNCSAEELPAHARIVWFQKRIEPAAVLAAMEQGAAKSATEVGRISLADLFIDWAGHSLVSAAVHARLASLKVGAAVRLRRAGAEVVIEAEAGPIAMLSRSGCSRWLAKLDRVVSACVIELVERHSQQSPPRWRDRLKCDHWLVPVVEVVLTQAAPALRSGSAGERRE